MGISVKIAIPLPMLFNDNVVSSSYSRFWGFAGG